MEDTENLTQRRIESITRSPTDTRRIRVNLILDAIKRAWDKENRSLDKDELISYCSIDWGISNRIITEYIKDLITMGHIYQEKADNGHLELWYINKDKQRKIAFEMIKYNSMTDEEFNEEVRKEHKQPCECKVCSDELQEGSKART